MPNLLINIIAKNPPSILLALGGVGYLASIPGAGILLFLGFLLQIVWLARYFI